MSRSYGIFIRRCFGAEAQEEDEDEEEGGEPPEPAEDGDLEEAPTELGGAPGRRPGRLFTCLRVTVVWPGSHFRFGLVVGNGSCSTQRSPVVELHEMYRPPINSPESWGWLALKAHSAKVCWKTSTTQATLLGEEYAKLGGAENPFLRSRH